VSLAGGSGVSITRSMDGKEGPQAEALALLARNHIKSDKLGEVCNFLVYAQDKKSEEFLRKVLEQNPHQEVQGLACLALASQLKNRLVKEPNLAKEVEQLFERAAEKYADVKAPFRGTVGARAKSELFEMRFLVIGKTAPDIEGEDQDGKPFKLSDYRGKVVLIDFWGNW
jgi:hypothetical protein